MKILLDAMGGDHAPEAMVEGAVLAANLHACDIVLVGQRERIEPILAGRGTGRISVYHASEVIDMHDAASNAIRAKKDSSLTVAMNLLAAGEGDALVTAGSTGAALSGATLLVKRIKGVRRAALAPILPTKSGAGSLLIDCGANVECTAEYLLQFAFLGSLYMEKAIGINRPRVGLINNGAEDSKGGPLQLEAFGLLKDAHDKGLLNFIGNIEGRDIPDGVADVLVCDGFTGNIVLKTIEGIALFLMGEIKNIMMESTKTKLAASVLKPGMKRLGARLDYKEIGGAPMLGISKPVIKAHGSCDAKAVCSAIGKAVQFAASGYIGHVQSQIEHMTVPKNVEETPAL